MNITVPLKQLQTDAIAKLSQIIF